jgi:hypothetical protein
VPVGDVDYALVREFVLGAEAGNLFTESLTFEAKERRNGANVAEAVAALSNSDGGIVLVGVKDKGAVGEARIVGVPAGEHDALVGSLHSYIPEAMPEVIPVAVPGGQQLVLVLRVDADAVPHPVVVSGRVMYRVPGLSVPADRRRVLELAARDTAAAQGEEHGRLHINQIYPHFMTVDLWDDEPPPAFDPEREPDPETVRYTGSVRVGGGLLLPRRAMDRPWLNLAAREAAQAAFESSPLCLAPGWSLPYISTVEARAGHLRFRTPLTPPGPHLYRVQCAADIRVVRRELQMAAALRWAPARATVGPGALMSLERIYHAVAGAMITVASTCGRVARAAGTAEPAEPLTWECSLHASSSDLGDIDFGVAAPNAYHQIPAARIPVSDVRELDRLARDWLTYYLLDRDAREFEQQIAGLALPDSFRVPDLP